MTEKIALRYWVSNLREALGKPVRRTLWIKGGPASVLGMPTIGEMAASLGMSVFEMGERMAQCNLTPWDVALEYVGADKDNFTFYSGPA